MQESSIVVLAVKPHTKLIHCPLGSPTSHSQAAKHRPLTSAYKQNHIAIITIIVCKLTMLSRLASSALPMRAVTRCTATAIAAARYSSPIRIASLDFNTTNLTMLRHRRVDPSAQLQVQLSSALYLAKLLSFQAKPSTHASASLPWPVDVFARTFEADRKFDGLSEAVVFGEKDTQPKVAHARQLREELWLERFGGPGKTLEVVVGSEKVVLREDGADGKGFLRVLV